MAVTDKAFYKQLGQRIAERRKALGMNQTQLADLFGISQQTMAKHENGTLRVAISMLPTLSEALGMSIKELIGVSAKKIAKPAAKKRGPTPRIQQQLEAVSALPRQATHGQPGTRLNAGAGQPLTRQRPAHSWALGMLCGEITG